MFRPSSRGIVSISAVVLNIVVQDVGESPCRAVRVSDLSTSETHGALDLVSLSQELEDTLLLHLEVTRTDLRPELDFLDDRAGLVLTGFARFDRLVVLELAVVHHPDDRRPSVGSNFDEVHPELRCKPARFFDVLLADLSAVWGDEPDALYANAFVYPWFRDVTTSWLFTGQMGCAHAEHHRCVASGGDSNPGTPQMSVTGWEAGASSCLSTATSVAGPMRL